MIRITLLCASLILLPNLTFADSLPLKEPSIKFAEWCKANQSSKCRAFTVAYRSAIGAYSKDHGSVPQVCVPDPIAGDELTARIIRRIESEPELQALNGGEAMDKVIEQDYPCK